MVATVDRRRWLAWVFGAVCAPRAAWGLDAPSALARPPAFALAQPAPPGLEPAGHLVSEKLDGVRAWWSGEALCFRSGLPIRAPGWFTDAMPAQPLDGELWLGRGRCWRIGCPRLKLPRTWQARRAAAPCGRSSSAW
jgi:DNA ligase-1